MSHQQHNFKEKHRIRVTKAAARRQARMARVSFYSSNSSQFSLSWCLSVEPLSPGFRVDTHYGLATDGLTSTNFKSPGRERQTSNKEEKKRTL